MNVKWAVERIIENKKVRCSDWYDEHYIYLGEGKIIDERGSTWIWSTSHILEDNWELFEEPNFKLSDKLQVGGIGHELYFEEDIKEFIKQLKNRLDKKYVNVGKHTELLYNKGWVEDIVNIIDDLLGDRFK